MPEIAPGSRSERVCEDQCQNICTKYMPKDVSNIVTICINMLEEMSGYMSRIYLRKHVSQSVQRPILLGMFYLGVLMNIIVYLRGHKTI